MTWTASENDRTDRAEGPFLPATTSAQGLEGFPISSLESRAAPRSLIAARATVEEQQGVTFVCADIVTGEILNLEALANDD